MNWISNTVEAIKDQLPLKRLWNNVVSLRIIGVLKRRSHWTRDGKVKVSYGRKITAEKARKQMCAKTGKIYSSYKCFWCPAYHIGTNGGKNPLPPEVY